LTISGTTRSPSDYRRDGLLRANSRYTSNAALSKAPDQELHRIFSGLNERHIALGLDMLPLKPTSGSCGISLDFPRRRTAPIADGLAIAEAFFVSGQLPQRWIWTEEHE
jgi:hypothetical protein